MISNEFTEAAKAAQDVAKAVGNGLDKVGKLGGL